MYDSHKTHSHRFTIFPHNKALKNFLLLWIKHWWQLNEYPLLWFDMRKLVVSSIHSPLLLSAEDDEVMHLIQHVWLAPIFLYIWKIFSVFIMFICWTLFVHKCRGKTGQIDTQKICKKRESDIFTNKMIDCLEVNKKDCVLVAVAAKMFKRGQFVWPCGNYWRSIDDARKHPFTCFSFCCRTTPDRRLLRECEWVGPILLFLSHFFFVWYLSLFSRSKPTTK